MGIVNHHKPRRILTLSALLSAMLSVATHAAEWRPTESEVALLPAYCKDRYDGNFKQSKAKWAILGDGFNHLHHYCNGLNFLNRAKAKVRDKEGRKFNLTNAENELQYVLDRTNDKYILAPDFYLARGEISHMQGRTGDAQNDFEKATKIKPDYPKAWIALSDFYRQTNRPNEARQALEDGLKAAPEKYKEYMKKRLAELPAGNSSPLAAEKPSNPMAK